MIDRATLLLAMPGFRVLNVTMEPDGGRLVLVESLAKDGGCPSCGVISSRVKDRPTCRLKDLPHGSVPLRLWVCNPERREGRSSCGDGTDPADAGFRPPNAAGGIHSAQFRTYPDSAASSFIADRGRNIQLCRDGYAFLSVRHRLPERASPHWR